MKIKMKNFFFVYIFPLSLLYNINRLTVHLYKKGAAKRINLITVEKYIKKKMHENKIIKIQNLFLIKFLHENFYTTITQKNHSA